MTTSSIQTKRLQLRLLTRLHREDLLALNKDLDVRKYFPKQMEIDPYTALRMDALFACNTSQELLEFAIFLKDSEDFVGRCGFDIHKMGEINVGYVLHKQFWGQGYASETLAALLKWAKDNSTMKSIVAYAPEEHMASQRVMQKCGMHHKKGVAMGVVCNFYRINL